MADGNVTAEMDPNNIHQVATEMEMAIVTLLRGSNQEEQQRANSWLTGFIEKPLTWTVALYLAFPPAGANIGQSTDVRFFALNMLLNKLRSDSAQLPMKELEEIYDVLWSQLHTTDDSLLKSRLCIVIAATCVLGGPEACFDVRTKIISSSSTQKLTLLFIPQLVDATENETDFFTSTHLLVSLAEEAIMRTRNLPWLV